MKEKARRKIWGKDIPYKYILFVARIRLTCLSHTKSACVTGAWRARERVVGMRQKFQ